MTDGDGEVREVRETLRERIRFHTRKLQRRPAYVSTRKFLRAAKRYLPNQWRAATHRHRQLPGLVIVGAQKAGTTQLYVYLTQHPCCFGGIGKEARYFSRHFDRPLSWYQSRFPLRRRVARVGGITLEASPDYLPTPLAIRRMCEVLPEAKVVVLVRDPVKRAFSHYQHYKTRQLESRPFDEIVQEALLNATYRPRLGDALRPDFPPMLDYVARGYYALQLEVLLDAYPREQVLVLDSAELFRETNAVCQQVFEFVGLDSYEIQPGKIHNRGYYREQIDPEQAALLREHYRPYDELLAELVGERFSWMDAGASRRAAA